MCYLKTIGFVGTELAIGKERPRRRIRNNVKSNTTMNTKTLVMGLALTGALMASTSAVKANAFLEVISGNTYTTVSVPGVGNDSASSTASIGGWTAQFNIGGTGAGGGGELDVDLNASTRGSSPTHGLTIIYSSGDPYSQQGDWTFGASEQNVQTVSASAMVYYSGNIYSPPSPAYNLGAFGTQLGTTISLVANNTGTNVLQGPLQDNLSAYYITEVLNIAGGASSLVAITPETVVLGTRHITTTQAQFNGGINFEAIGVPDGGLTMCFLGGTFLGVAGIRSKFDRKALRK